jgi:cell division protein FtsL
LPSARAAVVTAPGRPRPQSVPAGRQARARRRSRAKARGAILWIAVAAVLLAGVVFVNLAVLRLNLQLDRATKERTDLRAENAALQSQLSSSLASPRIQALAHKQEHLVPADPSTIGYLDLGRRG